MPEDKCPNCGRELVNVIYELKDGTRELASQACLHCTYHKPINKKIVTEEEAKELEEAAV